MIWSPKRDGGEPPAPSRYQVLSRTEDAERMAALGAELEDLLDTAWRLDRWWRFEDRLDAAVRRLPATR